MRSFARFPDAGTPSVKGMGHPFNLYLMYAKYSAVMDEDHQRRTRILNVILIGSIVMAAILDVIIFFYSIQEGFSNRELSIGAFSTLPVFFVFLYVLSRRGFSTIASYLLVAAYLASSSYAAYHWGATMQIVLLAYALVIVIATILHGTRFGFVVTGLITAYIIPLWYAQYHGTITTQVQKMRIMDALIFSVIYALIMVVAWLYEREVEQSIQRARGSEQVLKEERDLLEEKIVERTDELRKIQFEKMQQLNRLAELGQLSCGLFHDLLNLLNALSLRASDETDSSIASTLTTTRQIESFMQAVQKQIRGVDMQELFSLTQGVDHVIQLVNYQANKESVRVVFPCERRADITHFDAPFKFQEIVINLLLNAIESYEYLPRGDHRKRTVVITLEERDGIATLRVRDNGCGMTPEIQKKIFDLFFTTKEASKGIGVGLATIKKIIEHGLSGTITVESEPGRGSLFTVTFPIRHGAIPENKSPMMVENI
jgi:signal transduction histidine kinase